MKKFLMVAVAVTLLVTGCAGRSHHQLAAATHLDMMDRGVVVVNLSPQLIEARVYAPGQGTIAGPSKVYVQSGDQHAFVLYDIGGQSATVAVQPVDSNGRPIGCLENIRVSFPWGHYVGNAVDYSRNHIMVYYKDGRLHY